MSYSGLVYSGTFYSGDVNTGGTPPVDPTFPVVAVSSDGILTATVDPATASVFLDVDWHTMSPGLGLVYIQVLRTAAGVTSPVRGMDTITAPGGTLSGLDHEAPLGVLVTYTARLLAVSTLAVTATSTTAAVGIAVPRPVVWLKNLRTPLLSRRLTVNVMPSWDEDIQQGVFPLIGQRFPVVMQDVRQAETGTLGVKITTETGMNDLNTLLRSPGPYLLQTAGFLEPDRYITAGKVSKPRVTLRPGDAWRKYSIDVQTVDRPPTAGAVVSIPGKTFADSAATYATLGAIPGSIADQTSAS